MVMLFCSISAAESWGIINAMDVTQTVSFAVAVIPETRRTKIPHQEAN
jgi:hypothetical protein